MTRLNQKYARSFIALTLVAACCAAMATEYGTVISATAVNAPFAVALSAARWAVGSGVRPPPA